MQLTLGKWRTTCFAILLASIVTTQSTAKQTESLDTHKFTGTVRDSDGSTGIWYSGTPEWLTSQSSPESHWHKRLDVSFISFSHTTITKKEMKYIASLKNITSLFISCDPEEVVIEPDALQPLINMVWLKRLHIVMDDGMNDPCLTFISNLENLEDLHINGSIGANTVREIFKLKNLRELQVGGLKLPNNTSNEIAVLISKHPSLRSAQLGYIEDPTPILKGLGGSDLELLSLRTNSLSSEHIENIGTLTQLQQLFIEAISFESMAGFGKLCELRRLRLGVRKSKETCEFKFLSKLPQLRTLEILGIDSKRCDLDALRGHPNLRELIVPTVKFSDAELEILATMPRLKSISTLNRTTAQWRLTVKSYAPNVTVR